MKVCQVLLLGAATLMSSNEAVSIASHAQVLEVDDTADIVQLNTPAQRNVGTQRFLRRDTGEDKTEERVNFRYVVKPVVAKEANKTPDLGSSTKLKDLNMGGEGTSDEKKVELAKNFINAANNRMKEAQMTRLNNAMSTLSIKGGISKRKPKTFTILR
ncbi:unnamed protein product [Peronospora destructor]|uniref:RxLR effector protein n=1 Tax=Peronospora destructor TaxID=86335 RepID=A0AAV0TM69_9STRA|nr:unnamed protein product [Peronospora destructor]CAI5724280.1 unnamed protein product [Peronospora destructor]